MTKYKIQIIISMLIFGSIGLVTRNVALPSSFLAFIRAVLGVAFILFAMLISRKKIDFHAMKKNFKILLLSGALIGANWILLFEAYKHTSIAVATITYYFAPMFVVILTPIILKERISALKIGCMSVALCGMVLVSNVFGGRNSTSGLVGIALGLSAAICYAFVMILNKFLRDIKGIDSTIAQLSLSAIAVLPYILCTENMTLFTFSTQTILLLLLLGIVHTGIAYLFYFTSMLELKSTEIALFSYIDPISAIILSALILLEPISIPQIIGVVLVLSATIVSDIRG